MVHYNGFVFGANFSKLIIIREREAKKDEDDEESGSSNENDSESSEEKIEMPDESIVREDSVGY